jgi:toxin-antitoxin system PIN domain toxin
MLVDANILLFAIDESSPFHASAAGWLTRQLNGSTRVGLPWQSLAAFVRISTHPRATPTPLSPDVAWSFVESLLSMDVSWIPVPTSRHAEILGGLVTRYQLAGGLVQDAHLASIGIEHGLTVFSADTDFARFREVAWENPIQP